MPIRSHPTGNVDAPKILSLRIHRREMVNLSQKSGCRRRTEVGIDHASKLIQPSRRTYKMNTRNTLDCDQSNCSSRIVFSCIGLYLLNVVKLHGNIAIRSADPENPTIEPNMKWIGRPLAEIWPFEIFPNVRSSVVGRSVLNI